MYFSAVSAFNFLVFEIPNKATLEAKISIKLSRPKLRSAVEFSPIPTVRAMMPSTRLYKIVK